MKSFVWRIRKDRLKMFFAAFLFILPVLQVVQTVIFMPEAAAYNPYFATFQSLPAVNHHILQRLYTWFMPLYLLMIFAECNIEDCENRLKNIIICRTGKRRYVLGRLANGFTVSFCIVMLAMLVNLALCLIAFRNGTYMDIDLENRPDTRLYAWSFRHPLLANIAFDCVASYVSALICTVGNAISMLIPNRKIVYGTTLMLWLVPIAMKKSLVLLFQPFAEFDIDYLMPVFLTVTVSYIVLAAILTVWRLTGDEL